MTNYTPLCETAQHPTHCQHQQLEMRTCTRVHVYNVKRQHEAVVAIVYFRHLGDVKYTETR